MSQRSLEEFGAYQKARELSDYVVTDMRLVQRERLRVQSTPSSTGIMRERASDYGE